MALSENHHSMPKINEAVEKEILIFCIFSPVKLKLKLKIESEIKNCLCD